MDDYSKYFSEHLDIENWWNVIEIRVWSDSDFSRIVMLLKLLNEKKIQYILTIKSAHRTPQAMIDSAKAFPKILLSPEVLKEVSAVKFNVIACIAIAWGSAHIAWMTASETSIPVIALPVESSAGWIVDATFSMIDMPPGIPNWFIADQEIVAEMVGELYNLNLGSDFNKISIPDDLKDLVDMELLSTLWLTIWESPIWLALQNINGEEISALDNIKIPIIIPTTDEQITWDYPFEKMKNINQRWVYMWLTKSDSIRTTNALIYAAKVIWIFNPEVRKKVEQYSKNLTNEVREKDNKLLISQLKKAEKII